MPAEIKIVRAIPPLPARKKNSHKGDNGRVLILGGARRYVGAPALSGAAALRTGAGLVQVAAAAEVLPFILRVTPEMTGVAVESGAAWREALAKADSLVLGPGLGKPDARTARLLKKALTSDLPQVWDADALNWLARQKSWPKKFAPFRAVLTPHPGEMRRLLKFLNIKNIPPESQLKKRMHFVKGAAAELGQVLVLKGHHTLVSDGRRVYVNRTGDSSLAKAGSGDILSGMLGTVLAQKMEPFEAAVLAVYLHGRSGTSAGRKLGPRSVLARDVIAEIPAVLRRHQADR